MDLRRQLSGIPGVIVRANASGGNNQMNRFLSGGNQRRRPARARDSRRETSTTRGELALAREGPARHRARRRRRAPRARRGPARSWRCASIAPKAALLGVSATDASRTPSAPTSPAPRRRCSAQDGNEYPIIVRLREDERQNVDRRRRRAGQHAGGPGAAGEEPDARRGRGRSGRRSSARTSSASPTSAPSRKTTLSEAVEARRRTGCRSSTA